MLEANEHGLPVKAADPNLCLSALAYADDVVLLAKDRPSAQKLCDICSNFAEAKSMQWHCEPQRLKSKCEYMILNKPHGSLPGGKLVSESWGEPLLIHGRPLNEVQFIKVLDSTLLLARQFLLPLEMVSPLSAPLHLTQHLALPTH